MTITHYCVCMAVKQGFAQTLSEGIATVVMYAYFLDKILCATQLTTAK